MLTLVRFSGSKFFQIELTSLGEMIYIAGGAGDYPIEMWDYNGGSFTIYTTTSYTTYFMRSYAEIMIVDSSW